MFGTAAASIPSGNTEDTDINESTNSKYVWTGMVSLI